MERRKVVEKLFWNFFHKCEPNKVTGFVSRFLMYKLIVDRWHFYLYSGKEKKRMVYNFTMCISRVLFFLCVFKHETPRDGVESWSFAMCPFTCELVWVF